VADVCTRSSARTSSPSSSAILPWAEDVSKDRTFVVTLKGIMIDNRRKWIIYCSLFTLKDLCEYSRIAACRTARNW